MSPAFILGLIVAFGGALLLAFGSELQSRAVYHAGGRWRAFAKSPRWLAGLLLLAVAVGTNFIALALTPVSAVQSMSVTALASSAIFAGLTGRVEMTRVGVASVLLSIVGVLGFIAIVATHPGEQAGAHDPVAPLTTTTVILAALTLLGTGAALIGRRAPGRGVHLLGLLVAATMFGCITTVFKSIVLLVLADELLPTLASPRTQLSLAVVAAGGAIASILLQRSHQVFAVPVVVAALTIIDPLTAAGIGITVLGEAHLPRTAGIALALCATTACAGVVGVSRLRRTQEDCPPVPAVCTKDSSNR